MSENETELVATEVLATELIPPDVPATEVIGTVQIETPTEPVATQAFAEEAAATQAFAEEAAATQAFAEEAAATQAFADEAVPGTLLLTEPVGAAEAAESAVEAPTPAPASESTPTPTPTALRRVGPGVPVPAAGAGVTEIDPSIAAAWHGAAPEKPRRFPHRGWLLPLAVLVGVILLLLWQRAGGRLAVSGVSASVAASSIGCDSTEVVTATLRTNGHAGTIDYRWVRSDGTVSDELRQPVGEGTKQVDVVLRWAFTGHGSMDARATIQVDGPGTASSVASFGYNCP
ncbi:MAG TPA: hypothetical protein VFN97_03105 [Actinospica sp.]|nr:hypothetical protein [Actinospica sp.]